MGTTPTRVKERLAVSPPAPCVRYAFTMASGTQKRGRNNGLAGPAAKGVDRVLISKTRLQRRVRELADQLSAEYANGEIVCVGALNGVICFLADLVREMDIPAPVELVHVDRFIDERGHTVEMPNPFRESLRGRDVLIVEDIVDTGVTLKLLVDKVLAENPASVKVCTLLDKPAHREVDVQIDYVGFSIDPVFVVGYGLDYEGFYRNLPFVGVVDSAVWPPALLERPKIDA